MIRTEIEQTLLKAELIVSDTEFLIASPYQQDSPDFLYLLSEPVRSREQVDHSAFLVALSASLSALAFPTSADVLRRCSGYSRWVGLSSMKLDRGGKVCKGHSIRAPLWFVFVHRSRLSSSSSLVCFFCFFCSVPPHRQSFLGITLIR